MTGSLPHGIGAVPPCRYCGKPITGHEPTVEIGFTGNYGEPCPEPFTGYYAPVDASAGSQEPAPANPVGLACPECGAFVPEPAPKFGSVDGAPAERDDRADWDAAMHAVARLLCYFRDRDWRYDPGEAAHDHWRVKAECVLDAIGRWVVPRSELLRVAAQGAEERLAAEDLRSELARVKDQLDQAREALKEIRKRTAHSIGRAQTQCHDIADAALAASGVTEKGDGP